MRKSLPLDELPIFFRGAATFPLITSLCTAAVLLIKGLAISLGTEENCLFVLLMALSESMLVDSVCVENSDFLTNPMSD